MNENKNNREILINSILEKTNKYTREQVENILEVKENQIIDLVLAQTNLEREEAKKMLEENDYNSIKVIKMHFGIEKKDTDNSKVNPNQAVYKEIRNYMDTAAKTYRITKEIEHRREEFLEFLKEREKKEKGSNSKKLLTITEENDENTYIDNDENRNNK